MDFDVDRLVIVPDDIDLSRSPLAAQLAGQTYVLGAFNPGLTRLANGNLLMMVRVAEALREPIRDGHVHAIRWTADEAAPGGRYLLDAWSLEHADTADPRKFILRAGEWKTMALTSLSWLLPRRTEPRRVGAGGYPLRPHRRSGSSLPVLRGWRTRGSARWASAG